MANTVKQPDVKSESQKDPMVSFIVDEFQRYESHWRDRFEKAKKIYDMWLNKPPTRTFDWQNQVHVPMMVEAEQTITPRLFAALFPTEAPIDCQVYGEASEEQAIIIKSMIAHEFRVSDVQGESIPALTQCCLLGTGYIESPWLVERTWQVDKSTMQRYLAVTANRPDCKAVNFFEFYPHPAKLSMRDGLPLIRRRFCDAEYLKRLAENPHFKMENLQTALASESVVDVPATIVDQNGKAMNLKQREKYELLEYWGPWDTTYEKDGKPKKDLAVPHWIIVVNRSVKIRSIPNPFNHQRPPFCKLKLFEDVNPSWFGIGVGQVGYPTQERLNKIVNQRLDNVDLVLNKQGFYNGNDTLINTKKLQVSKPGQWHKVSDTVTSIRWMDTPDVTQSSYKEEEIAKQDFRESTGATVPLMPTDEGQHRTAMGINLLQGAAGARFRPVLRRLETDFIQDLAFMYLSNLQQFMTTPEWISVTGEQGKKQPIMIRPEDIQAKVLFIPTGLSETLNKEVQIGQLLRFKEVSVQDPTVNRTEINKRIAELMGFKDIEKLLIPQQNNLVQPGGLAPNEQQQIRQRLSEGATPEQIRLELLGPPPANEQPAPGPGGPVG
jgi:hypothetical protein